MRVLALTNLYPNPYQPNRAPFNRHPLRLLAEQHAVRVIAPIAWTDELRARRSGTVKLPSSRRIEWDGLTVDHPSYWFPPGVLRGCYGRFYLWSVQRAFWRAVREFKPTVLFAPWAYPDGWAAVELGRRAGLPVVVKVLGSDILMLPQFPARRPGTEAAVRAADAVLAVSADLRERLVAMGVERERIRVIYDGVNSNVFRPGSRAEARQRVGFESAEPLVLFVGNLVAVKGIDVLLEACARLEAEGKKKVRLVVIGSGLMRAAHEQQARRLGLSERVAFLGSLPQEQLADWYRAADLFVLPSYSEGVPNVLLEASACGTPWIASAVGGIPEIAHLGVSLLVSPNQPSQLAEAMSQMLAWPEKGLDNSVRSLEDVAEELKELLQSVDAAQSRRLQPKYELEARQ